MVILLHNEVTITTQHGSHHGFLVRVAALDQQHVHQVLVTLLGGGVQRRHPALRGLKGPGEPDGTGAKAAVWGSTP
eukprot:6411755-Pyramimonas_sp.AAC.1